MRRKPISDALLRSTPLVGRLVRRVVKAPGTSPGTLVHTGAHKVERIRIHALHYDAERFVDRELDDVAACFPLEDAPTVSWVNVDGLHDVDLVRVVGDRLGWHPLLLEDIVAVGQRAKVEEYDGYLFVVIPMLAWDDERMQVVEEQLSLVLGDRYVFTFQERFGDVFDGVRDRLRKGRGRLRQRGVDYLAYALVDAVVDHYFTVLERIGDVTEHLEEEVLVEPAKSTLVRLHELKRELIQVRRAVWSVRDMLASLVRDESEQFSPETEIYLRDVHDHAVQVVDTVEALRDVVSSAVDLYLSMMGYRTNEVMKVLTIMASIFIPLTFFTGIYGMNFDYMPELHVRWGYPALLASMVLVASVMVAYFRRKRWV